MVINGITVWCPHQVLDELEGRPRRETCEICDRPDPKPVPRPEPEPEPERARRPSREKLVARINAAIAAARAGAA